jgi:hypothetical protein
MPDHLVDILDEWHKENGREFPPCKYTSNRPSLNKWKVFDREGKELELSRFEVVWPCTYMVLVLHSPDFQQKLVRSRWPHGAKRGIFLIAWRGMSNGFEAKCCAIRIFAPVLEDIVYSPHIWKEAVPDLDPAGEGIKRRHLSGATAPSQSLVPNRGQEPQRESEREKRMRKRRAPRAPREIMTDNSNSEDASESSDETDSSTEESSDASSSSEEEEEGNVTAPVPKRRRRQQQTSNTLARTRKATSPAKPTSPAKMTSPTKVTNEFKVTNETKVTNTTKVTFKLVSYRSGGAIRAFPLEECKTGRDLFDKAQKFFRLFDKNVNVTILACQISSERAQHFLFGSEGEFELLVKQARDKSTEDGTVTIEVNHVLEP